MNDRNYKIISILVAVVALAGLIYAVRIKPNFLETYGKRAEAQKNKNQPQTPPTDPFKSLQWTLATSTAPWGERDAHSVSVFKDYLYLIGGLQGNKAVAKGGTIEYWNAPHMSDIWRSADGENWELVTDKAPWHNRRSVTTVVFQDKLWLMGGWDQYDYKYDNRIWFTEDGTHWKLATSTPTRWPGREGHTLNELNGRLWLMGGVDFTKRITYNDVWYSDDGFTWIQATSSAPWSGRYDHAASAFKGKLYLAGGVHINSHLTEAEVWSTADGFTWEKTVPEWPSRHGQIFLEYKNLLWIIGGWHSDTVVKKNDQGINDTWYSEDGIKWKKTDTDGPWIGREDTMGEVFKDKIWLTGGMDTNLHWSADVWYLGL